MKVLDLISKFTKDSIAIDPLDECQLPGEARVTLKTYSHSRQHTNFCFLATSGDYPEITVRLNTGNTRVMIWKDLKGVQIAISISSTPSLDWSLSPSSFIPSLKS
jgi:hypothetical protein